MSTPETQAPPDRTYRVLYRDDRGYEWEAVFLTADEALEQAAIGVVVYGGVAPQAVVDANGTVIYDQAAIIAVSESL